MSLMTATAISVLLIAGTPANAVSNPTSPRECTVVKKDGISKIICTNGGPGLKSATNSSNSAGVQTGRQRYLAQKQNQIQVSAQAHGEFKADEITFSVRFGGAGKTMNRVIDALKEKRNEIPSVTEKANMRVTGLEISQLDIRKKRRGNSDDEYSGSTSILVSISGFSDPLDVAAKLGSLSAENIGQLQYSLSDPAISAAEGQLKKRALENAGEQAMAQATARGVKLGKLLNFQFNTSNNRRYRSGQYTIQLGGRGTAVYAVEQQ